MKSFYFLLILILFQVSSSYAQKLEVDTMYLAQGDLTASTQRRNDFFGEGCALVKVRMPRSGASFEGNVIEPTSFSQSEYMVYMNKDSKKLTVKLAGYIPVDVVFSNYGVDKVESLRTYILTILVPNNGGGLVEDGMSYVSVTVSPKNAILIIDDSYKMLDDEGMFLQRMPRGTHRYRILAEGHQDKEGEFILGESRVDIVETLVSTMAKLVVRCATSDAEIRINDQSKGKGRWDGSIVPGNYLVEVCKPGFISQRKSVSVLNNETRTVDFPALSPSVGQLDVKYKPIAAEVWIDGKKAGTSPDVFKNLSVGSHRVEIRKDGYQSKTETVNIKNGEIASISGSLPEDNNNVNTSITGGSLPSNGLSGEVQVVPWDSLRWIYGNMDKELLSQLSKKGDAMAQYIIANEIYNEARLDDSSKAYKEAYNLFKKSAKQGNAFSQNRLGELYLWGNGVEKNYTEALKWFRLSAEQGLKDGQYNLGEMYEYGEGIPQDYEQAKFWYQKAADQGGYGAKEALFNLQALISCATSTTISPIVPAFPPSKHKFTVNGVDFTMVCVEGGTFTMGATSEQGRVALDDEKPVHQVTLSTYLIGETEVTLQLWTAVMGNAGWDLIKSGSRIPVHNVNWDRIQVFIKKLNEMTGKTFRLPTEAEWEFAARGGNLSRGYRYAGSNSIDDIAWHRESWYREKSLDKGKSSPDYGPHFVAMKLPNELGLYDMSGNVEEMCNDWYKRDYYNASPQTNPQGPEKPNWLERHHVTRGGSYDDWGRECRTSARSSSFLDNGVGYIGFRLVLSE